MSEETRTYALEYREGALVKLLLTALFLIAACVWCVWNFYHEPVHSMRDYIMVVIGPPFGFGMLFMAYGSVRLLLKRSPALVLDARGVTHNSGIGEAQFADWSEVGSFVYRVESGYRGKPMPRIDVVASMPQRKVLFTVNADDLVLTGPTVVEHLQEHAAAIRAPLPNQGMRDTPIAAKPQPVKKMLLTGMAIFLVIGLLCGAPPFLKQFGHLASGTPKDWSVAGDVVELDKFIAENSMMQAMKKADPEQFAKYRQGLIDARRAGMTDREMTARTSALGNEYMTRRMTYASPATLRKFMEFRLKFQERIGKESPDALYSMLITGKYDSTMLSDSFREQLVVDEKNLSDTMAKLILAPQSDTPIPQDKAMIGEGLQQVQANLSDTEFAVLRSKPKTTEQRKQYCDAFMHLNQEVLKLPDEEMVQVLRDLNELPKDDRLATAAKAK